MSIADIYNLTMHVLAQAESVNMTLAKLDILADRQWHAYELPSPKLKQTLRKWLIQHWISNDQVYLENVLGLAYCFGLDKELYQEALEAYSGDGYSEFRENLARSEGDNIDPWWSMNKRNV